VKESVMNKVWILFALILFVVIGAAQSNGTAKKFTAEQTMEHSIIETLKNDTATDSSVAPDKKNTRKTIKTLSVMEGNLSLHITTNNSLTDLTKHSLLAEILTNSTNIFQEVFSHELKSANILWDLPLIDSFGDEHDETVLVVTLTEGKAKNINWNNLSSENLPKVADHFWQHAFFNGGQTMANIGFTPY